MQADKFLDELQETLEAFHTHLLDEIEITFKAGTEVYEGVIFFEKGTGYAPRITIHLERDD